MIPIYRPKAGALPAAEILRRNLAQELFALNPFQVTGPVVNDMDFYGRGNDALDLLRQLQAGRIRSLFGIRKVGKTSLINRVVNLARDAGSPRIAMIDCSVDEFNKLSVGQALKAVAKVAKLAAHSGYGHISDALKRSDQELVPAFDDLWSQAKAGALAIVFDEIDYITPSSPTRPHWKKDFNPFWREFRVVYQEAQRQGAPLAVLVSGVSSRHFRIESIGGVENSVLHFVPEDYLPPFARDASKAMLKDLERRCGLILTDVDRNTLAQACGDFPYWMRMAGSYIHQAINVDGRPLQVPSELFSQLMEEFIIAEGTELARVALEDLRRKYPDVVTLLRSAASQSSIPLAEGRLLARYGLAVQKGTSVYVQSSIIRRALDSLQDEHYQDDSTEQVLEPKAMRLAFDTEEWAEELSVISRRRNLLEKKIREFARVVLKIGLPKGESWTDKVLSSIPENRRSELRSLAGDTLLSKLFWQDLEGIINKNWQLFERTIGDKNRFNAAMALLNDRPDAHAKPVDAADLALYRRELNWLEERIA